MQRIQCHEQRWREGVCFARDNCRNDSSVYRSGTGYDRHVAHYMFPISRAPTRPESHACAWMSGWFNQKTGYVWVDLDAYARNVANVTRWCETYPDQLVMNGLQRATGK